jgi:hypothetical protein
LISGWLQTSSERLPLVRLPLVRFPEEHHLQEQVGVVLLEVAES